MMNPDVLLSSEDFIQTSSGNIISRNCTICKTQSVELPNGKCIINDDVIIRADLAPVQLQKYCFIGKGTVLHPSYTSNTKAFKFIPLTIGSHCYIGQDCIIEAAVIGVGCDIGDNCIISKRCILKDYVKVLEGSVLSPDQVIPPFSIISGNPAQVIGQQHESTCTIFPLLSIDRYRSYKVYNKSK